MTIRRIRPLGVAALACVSLGACLNLHTPIELNVAPEVRIVAPAPSADVVHEVPQAVTIRYEALDADAPRGRPVRFRYLLLDRDSEFPMHLALADPDSLRRFYAPDFHGWHTLPGIASSVTLEDLIAGREYLFVITALDPHGGYDPVFALDRNMLRLRAGEADEGGPRIAFGAAGAPVEGTIFIELPAGTDFRVEWMGIPEPGTFICGYRAFLDGEPLAGTRIRGCGRTCDPRCWNSGLTSIRLGPFAGGERHLFTVEASDNFGRVGGASIEFQVVQTTYSMPLLIVDDTRFLPDTRPAGSTCTAPPMGAWPTAAELDTFLFARGGYPWRCYGPAGTMSPPGLFAGYPFDTIGTRTGIEPAVRLETLAQYRHVIWLVDRLSASNSAPPSDRFAPITSLRYMSGPGGHDALAAYAASGGKVWLAGAGGARASLMPWNVAGNDGPLPTWSASAGELIPGRLLYDHAGWRSEIQSATATGFITRMPGASARLPVQLRPKSPALDPLPPGRIGQPSSAYYAGQIDVEFLSAPNVVVENGVSVLDSLYEFVTFDLPPAPGTRRVTMTRYHGSANGGFVTSGFDIWRPTRADAQALIDFVLQDDWGLQRTPAPALATRAAP